ncbi:DUF4974 domain-containing protein [Chitinophaga sp. SYP-B3965]|uniref:FecR family protein n=1 Tax=Chitinophaga sp. SYP-B3965 TaxID=2663120 RepID=UPI00129994FC|nr:FecR domain-containing protein [Chitinophaga sp. SYP-B3965]MRG43596.1 DUF4974 domain-containing protein [Chitinophaga sp. SYP-B3965]
MNKSEFLALSDKYLKGTLTPEEELRFLDACASLEGRVPQWDEQLLGSQQVVKDRLYENIVRTATRKRFNYTWLRVAAVVMGISIVLGIYRAEIRHQLFPVKMLMVETGKADMKRILLPDGSTVLLNKQGSISYPEEFRDSIRLIRLSGEAYFEVTHTGQPFIIQTDKLSTRVLGTSFVVKSYPGDHQSKVTLISGKVAVQQMESKDGVVLLPGQEVTSFNGHLAVKNHVDTAWMNNKLSFRQSPLAEVIDDLERKFDIRIQTDDHLLQCLIYVDVAPGDTPMSILGQLAISLDGKVLQSSPGVYKLTGKGCDD